MKVKVQKKKCAGKSVTVKLVNQKLECLSVRDQAGPDACFQHVAEAPMANFFRRISAKILRISENFFQKFCVKFYVKKRVITTFLTKKHVNATFATKKCVIAASTDSRHK